MMHTMKRRPMTTPMPAQPPSVIVLLEDPPAATPTPVGTATTAPTDTVCVMDAVGDAATVSVCDGLGDGGAFVTTSVLVSTLTVAAVTPHAWTAGDSRKAPAMDEPVEWKMKLRTCRREER